MIFGDDLFADSLFGDAGIDPPDPQAPAVPGVWVEQCPTVTPWNIQAKQGSTWNNQAKNLTTTEKCST